MLPASLLDHTHNLKKNLNPNHWLNTLISPHNLAQTSGNRKVRNPQKSTRIDQDYRVEDQFIIRRHAASKYETTFKDIVLKVQTWKNGTIALQTGAVTQVIKISRNKT